MKDIKIDHLFRHQHGKMVSILTRIFGFQHLETIEDAIQDTFIKALKTWRVSMPENPEAWLTAAAKNRTIDLFRKIKSANQLHVQFDNGPSTIAISEMFLEHEIEDSQLKMIFTACHPSLDPRDQIAFALKTISGFSQKEIAAALLTKDESIKKRLQRARKNIIQDNIEFKIPIGKDLPDRLDRVLETIYLIFNEGFQSIKKDMVIRKDLCGEAIRLCQMILNKEAIRTPKLYALFALLCFHSARLESKVGPNNEIINLKNQDRGKWYFPLISLGNDAMNKAMENNTNLSSYHYEAAIAFEHLKSPSFEATDWKVILHWYQSLDGLQDSPHTKINLAIVHLQLNQLKEAKEILDHIDAAKLAQRMYLYHGTLAEYYFRNSENLKAIFQIDLAINLVNNAAEKNYLLQTKARYKSS